jgi:hypothetical protein
MRMYEDDVKKRIPTLNGTGNLDRSRNGQCMVGPYYFISNEYNMKTLAKTLDILRLRDISPTNLSKIEDKK